MRLFCLNHPFDYEAERMARLFLPDEKFEKLYEPLDSTGDEVVTLCQSGEIKCAVRLGGREAAVSLPCGDSDSKETELALGRAVIECFEKLGFDRPPWGLLTGVRPVKLMRTYVERYGERAGEEFSKRLLVSEGRAKLAHTVALAEEKAIDASRVDSVSVYVSIPFCPTRCSYCSFVSHSIERSGQKLIAPYVERLQSEIKSAGELIKRLGLRLETVYIGGGTPTTLDASELERLLDTCRGSFDMKSVREFTVEAGRPDTITRFKLETLKAYGVKRISVNPQTFSDATLERIGRRHTAAETVEKFLEARDVGFETINTDFIAGLPGESESEHIESLERAIELRPENITVHALTIKRASRLNESGEYERRAAETLRMIERGRELLSSSGYSPYYLYRQSGSVGNLENTGFTLPGHECFYNIYMMEEIHSVIGCGAGAVTRLKAPGENVIERAFNFKYPYEYVADAGGAKIKENHEKIAAFYEKQDLWSKRKEKNNLC